MTDTQAPGWRHPGQHLARRVEVRTPAEMLNLLTLDALIATYGMDGNEVQDLMLLVRSLYRGGGVTRRQALFLHDLSRSLGDLARLRFQLGEDEARRAHQSQVRPPSLGPLRERRVVGVPAVEDDEPILPTRRPEISGATCRYP
jgi:hypothetical protein